MDVCEGLVDVPRAQDEARGDERNQEREAMTPDDRYRGSLPIPGPLPSD